MFCAALLAVLTSVAAADLSELMNPDDVMLRKPTTTRRSKIARRVAAHRAAEKAEAEQEAAEKAAKEKAAAEAKAKAEAEEKAVAEAKAKAEAEAKAAAAAKEKAQAEARAAKEKAEAEAKAAAAAKAKAEAEAAARAKAEAEARKAAEAKAAAEASARKAAADKAAAEAAAQKLREQVAEAEEARAKAEKKADYLANPDPDERPKPKKLEVTAMPDVTEAPASKRGMAPSRASARAPKSKELTGRAAVITADRTDYDRKEGVILFDRNVFVDDEQYQMHAERLFVFLDGTNDMKRLVALGNVAITNDDKSAWCSKAVYVKAASRIVLYGSEEQPAWLRDAGSSAGDASEVRGLRITYWIDSGLATVEKSVITLPGLKGSNNPKDLFNPGAKKNKDE